MSALETPPPAPPTERRCPRCGAPMTDEQEWCLHCGAAVGTRVVAAPGWRAPLVIAGTVLVLAVIAIAVAIVQLADDTDEVAQNPAPTPAATPPPAVTPTPDPALPGTTPTPDPALPGTTPTPGGTPSPTATPSPTTTPEPASTPDPGGGSGGADWPAGESGWTVVLASETSRSTAEGKADDLAADGISGVGVLNSDDFSSLNPGFWVVFSGQYDSQAEARDALDGIDAADAYIRRIVPD